MYVVLVYDISKDENGQKRWSHIFKICKEFWGKEDDKTSFIL